MARWLSFFALLFLFPPALQLSAGEPALAWQLHLTDFPSLTSDPHNSGRVCSHPIVRGESMLLIQPEGTLTATNRLAPAIITTHALATGKELKRYTSPITRSTVQTTNAGSTDTDLVCGVYWSELPGNTIMAAAGGDIPGMWWFDVDTGATKTIPVPGIDRWPMNPNCSTAFTAHPKVPFVILGGSANHSSLGSNGGITRLSSNTTVPWVGYRQWCTGLVHEGTQAAYRLDDLARVKPGMYGFRMWGISAIHGGVGCEIPGWLPYSANGNDGFGYPKPTAMLTDGRTAVLCSTARASFFGAANTRSFNDYKDTRIVLIDHKPNGKTGSIPGFTSWKSLDYTLSEPINFTDNGMSIPQLITTGDTILAFWPPMENHSGFLCSIDLAGKIVWKNSVTVLKRFAEAYRRDNFPRHLTVAVGLLGKEPVVLEADSRTLYCRRYSATTGQLLGAKEYVLELPRVPDTGYMALQSVQPTSSGLLLSILYRSGGRTHQSLALLTDNQPPPVVPTTPTPEQEVLDFAKPRLPPEKYSAIEKVLQ